MKNLTIRDFRTRPRAVREEIAAAGQAVLTVSGRPIAVMLSVEGGLEETLALIARVRAQRAVGALRAEARASGADRLAPRAIHDLVKKVRKDRRKRRPA